MMAALGGDDGDGDNDAAGGPSNAAEPHPALPTLLKRYHQAMAAGDYDAAARHFTAALSFAAPKQDQTGLDQDEGTGGKWDAVKQ